jgi:hypothetical protein
MPKRDIAARHDTDPVLWQLVRAVNESEDGAVPVAVSVHGTRLTGDLVTERRYFTELVQRNPLMSALDPSSGLLGKDYVKDAESGSRHHLHILADRPGDVAGGEGGMWRVSLDAVDAWSLRHGVASRAGNDRGPFARLLGTP